MLAQQEGNLGSILQLQLSQDNDHLIPYRERRTAQALGNLLIAQSVGYQYG
jgi:hypothetical protein